MNDIPYNPQEFEARARKAVVDIAQAYIKASSKTMHKTMAIGALGLLPLFSPSLQEDKTLLLGSTSASAFASLWFARRQQKSVRQEFEEIMNTVPSGASGIVRHELRDFEKAINTGKLNFGAHDVDPRKHYIKYAASVGVGLFMPAFMPAQYLLMLTMDENIKASQATVKAVNAIKANKPTP